MLVHAGSPRALGVHGFSGETLEEERLSYLRSLQRHAAVEYGEVRRVLALKRGVGDHTPERFADHELGSCYRGGSDRNQRAIDDLKYKANLRLIETGFPSARRPSPARGRASGGAGDEAGCVERLAG